MISAALGSAPGDVRFGSKPDMGAIRMSASCHWQTI
jgi:hypothetical protein